MDAPSFARCIVAGTDGSADAMTAMHTAAALAEQLDVEVVVVHCLMLLEHLEGHSIEPAVKVRHEVRELLETTWSEPFAQRNVRYRCVLEDGPPLLALPRVAAREDASLIVVASHGEGGDRLKRLGSTSDGLVHYAPLPVLVVPCRPEATGEHEAR